MSKVKRLEWRALAVELEEKSKSRAARRILRQARWAAERAVFIGMAEAIHSEEKAA